MTHCRRTPEAPLMPLARPSVAATALGAAIFALCASAAWAQEPPPGDDMPLAAPRDERRADPSQPERQQQRPQQRPQARDPRQNRERPEAQTPDDGKAKVQRQAPITVQGRRQLDDRQVNTASKLVITKEDMEQYGDTNIADVLKRAPGVTVGGAAGRGGGEIRMRGLGAGYTQILVNGDPAPPGFSLDTLSPDQLERIEIFRTATAQFSTQAVAGSINIVLKEGVSRSQRDVKLGVRLGTRKGVFLSTSIAEKVGDWAYNLGLSTNRDLSKYDGERVEVGVDANGVQNYARNKTQINSSRNHGLSLTPRITYTPDAANTFSLDAFVRTGGWAGTFDERSITSLGTPPPFGAAHSDVSSDMNMLRGRLSWTRKFEDGAKLEARGGVNRNRRTSSGAFAGTNPLGQLSLLRQTESGGSDDGKSFSAKFTQPTGGGHTWIGGIDFQTSHREETRNQDEQSPLGLPLTFAREAFAADVRRTAAFLQDEWDITPKWSMYMGLRSESITTTSEGNTYARIDNTGRVLSPIWQSLWKLPDTKGDQIRLGLSRTFKAPGTGQLIPRRFTAVNNTSITPDSQGNPLLQPELATGIDLAYERFFGVGGVFSVSTYVRQISGLISSQTTLQGARWVSQPTNLGKADVRGIELEFKTALKNIMADAPPIDIRLNGGRNASRVDAIPGPGNRLAAQTPSSANIGVDYRPSPEWTFGSSYSFSGGGYFRRSVAQSGFQSRKRELDAYALWRINPATNLRVSAVNLLQRNASGSSTFSDANGSLTSSDVSATHAALRVNFEAKFR